MDGVDNGGFPTFAGAHRPVQGGHNTGSNGLFQPQGGTNRHHVLAHRQVIGVTNGNGGHVIHILHLDDGHVGVTVAGNELGPVGAAVLKRHGHFGSTIRRPLNHMVVREHITVLRNDGSGTGDGIIFGEQANTHHGGLHGLGDCLHGTGFRLGLATAGGFLQGFRHGAGIRTRGEPGGVNTGDSAGGNGRNHD